MLHGPWGMVLVAWMMAGPVGRGAGVNFQAASPILPAAGYCAGDADFSGRLDVADVMVLVNFVFRNGPKPDPYYLQGDVNCDGWVDTRDIIGLASHLYKGTSLCEFCASVFPGGTQTLEAQTVAMWYAGTLEPPLKLTKRILRDLHTIRTDLVRSDPALDGIFFTVPWGGISRIHVGFDSSTAHQVRDSNYHEWDAINQGLGLDSVRDYLWREGVIYSFSLYFSGVKNPTALARAYDPLPGVVWTSAGGLAGSPTNNILPRVHGDTVAYLLIQGWGDCPSGCLHGRYYYISGTCDSLWYLGRWPTGNDPSEPKPAWWPLTCEHFQLVWPHNPCD